MAISNRRLLSLGDGKVTFRWKDYAHGNQQRCMTLSAIEFVRRFLQHVLPTGFVKIRHYGFMSNRFRQAKLKLCRRLLKVPVATVVAECPAGDLPETGENQPAVRRCPHCGEGHLHVVEQLPSQLGRTHWTPQISLTYQDTS